MAFDFKRRILNEDPHSYPLKGGYTSDLDEKTRWITTKGGHTLEIDDDGNVLKGIFTGANLKDKKSIEKKISKLEKSK
ncbi:MAG: hypothetical protein GX265_02020 [Mollicutes bacterium]|nr:hypothetical protein [Mollicutes bacterium]